MSNEPINKSTIPTRIRGRGKRFTKEQRDFAQTTFLESFKLNANITIGCKQANIDRGTFYQWLEHDTDFSLEYKQAELAANDMLLAAAWKRGVQGYEEPMVSMGKVVYEDVPAFNRDGTPKLDVHGKQVMLHGKPLMKRVYSDTVLLRLMSARMPAFREKQSVEMTGKDGGPIEVRNTDEEIMRKIEAIRASKAAFQDVMGDA